MIFVVAAHCIKDSGVKERHVRALLGRLNITDETEKGWIRRNISAIKLHENYAINTAADSDIAVLILDEPVQFTDYIQPICLPAIIDNVVNVLGTVAGYGNVNKTSSHQSIPFHAELSTVSPFECVFSHKKGIKTVSTNSFCAKSNVSVPCIGEL